MVIRLREHVTLWWNKLQADQKKKGKENIKSWDHIVGKFKIKFMPKVYQLNLFRNLQNIRKKTMTVKEFIE